MNAWRPFPINALPESLARFIAETARAVGCDPAFVGVPMLSVLAGAVGTTRAIELRDDWRERRSQRLTPGMTLRDIVTKRRTHVMNSKPFCQ